MRRDRAVSTTERQQLCALAERLRAELTAASNPRHVDTVVTRVLLGFEQGRGRGDDENDWLVAEYVSALKALPLAAIHAAAERFRSGETLRPWSKRFRPSPAEFADEVREGQIPLKRQLLHIRHVLEAEVYDEPTPEQRAEVARVAEAHLQRMRQPEPERRRAETPAEIARAQRAKLDEDLARLRATGHGPDIGRLMARLDQRQGQAGGAR
ncbi:hypothetical protein [Methylobacterium radiotolerans]|uniref:hypothetical protein n=1 Tax=Methylobacterium radiotolerans TaxID=31998 RepID=UPI0002FDD13F|nr:hypothetical protein [Methylobacterium radiotolerans]GEM95895.1 hypothetical protein MRA01_04350 [Methylobacterium radiotolerans]